MNEVERKSKSNLKMTKREGTPGRENGRQEGLRSHMQVITARCDDKRGWNIDQLFSAVSRAFLECRGE